MHITLSDIYPVMCQAVVRRLASESHGKETKFLEEVIGGGSNKFVFYRVWSNSQCILETEEIQLAISKYNRS